MKFSKIFSVFLIHSFCITYFQVFSIIGIHPAFIESKIFCTNSTNIDPLNNFLWKDFGLVILKTFFLNSLACIKNSFLNSLSGKFCKFCKSFSFSTGLTIVKQSLSGKKVFIKFLTLFFSFITSVFPLIFSNAFSKYCFSVITLPFLSSNFKLKSLNNHNKEGKYSANSASSSIVESFLILIVSLKFKIKLKVFIAFSSKGPKELKINKELIKIATKKIFESWFISSSYAPKPSVSIKKHGKGWLHVELLIIKGSDHIHIPFVHGLNVGPTPKPLLCWVFKITLFNKKDFPVLYFPTKLIIPKFVYSFWFNNSRASSVTLNSLFSYITKGIAFCLYLFGLTLRLAPIDLELFIPFPSMNLCISDIDSSILNVFGFLSILFLFIILCFKSK